MAEYTAASAALRAASAQQIVAIPLHPETVGNPPFVVNPAVRSLIVCLRADIRWVMLLERTDMQDSRDRWMVKPHSPLLLVCANQMSRLAVSMHSRVKIGCHAYCEPSEKSINPSNDQATMYTLRQQIEQSDCHALNAFFASSQCSTADVWQGITAAEALASHNPPCVIQSDTYTRAYGGMDLNSLADNIGRRQIAARLIPITTQTSQRLEQMLDSTEPTMGLIQQDTQTDGVHPRDCAIMHAGWPVHVAARDAVVKAVLAPRDLHKTIWADAPPDTTPFLDTLRDGPGDAEDRAYRPVSAGVPPYALWFHETATWANDMGMLFHHLEFATIVAWVASFRSRYATRNASSTLVCLVGKPSTGKSFLVGLVGRLAGNVADFSSMSSQALSHSGKPPYSHSSCSSHVWLAEESSVLRDDRGKDKTAATVNIMASWLTEGSLTRHITMPQANGVGFTSSQVKFYGYPCILATSNDTLDPKLMSRRAAINLVSGSSGHRRTAVPPNELRNDAAIRRCSQRFRCLVRCALTGNAFQIALEARVANASLAATASPLISAISNFTSSLCLSPDARKIQQAHELVVGAHVLHGMQYTQDVRIFVHSHTMPPLPVFAFCIGMATSDASLIAYTESLCRQAVTIAPPNLLIINQPANTVRARLGPDAPKSLCVVDYSSDAYRKAAAVGDESTLLFGPNVVHVLRQISHNVYTAYDKCKQNKGTVEGSSIDVPIHVLRRAFEQAYQRVSCSGSYADPSDASGSGSGSDTHAHAGAAAAVSSGRQISADFLDKNLDLGKLLDVRALAAAAGVDERVVWAAVYMASCTTAAAFHRLAEHWPGRIEPDETRPDVLVLRFAYSDVKHHQAAPMKIGKNEYLADSASWGLLSTPARFSTPDGRTMVIPARIRDAPYRQTFEKPTAPELADPLLLNVAACRWPVQLNEELVAVLNTTLQLRTYINWAREHDTPYPVVCATLGATPATVEDPIIDCNLVRIACRDFSDNVANAPLPTPVLLFNDAVVLSLCGHQILHGKAAADVFPSIAALVRALTPNTFDALRRLSAEKFSWSHADKIFLTDLTLGALKTSLLGVALQHQ